MKKKALSLMTVSSFLFLVLALLDLTSIGSAEAVTLRLSNGLAPGTFQNKTLLPAFAKEVREAELGISLVVSAPFDLAWKVADMAGAMGHTIEYSGGIWGKTEKLPAPEVLEFTTMCGHGMISRYLVEDVIKRVKAGSMSAKEGSVEIGKQCCCGIYNPDRGEKLLKALAAS